MSEIIDDVVFARAPLDAEGAFDLLGALRTVRRLPEVLPDSATPAGCRVHRAPSRRARPGSASLSK